jgi:hypothetical protein
MKTERFQPNVLSNNNKLAFCFKKSRKCYAYEIFFCLEVENGVSETHPILMKLHSRYLTLYKLEI